MGGGPPGFPQDFTCLAVLWYCPPDSDFPYRTVTFFGPAFLRCSSRLRRGLRQPATPPVRRPAVWPSPSSLATTEGIEFSFFSSRYLDVSVPGVPSCKTMDSSYGDSGSRCRVSPFGDPWINARFQLPMAFRRSLRPSSATGAKASSLCSCSLEQALHQLYLCLPLLRFRYLRV